MSARKPPPARDRLEATARMAWKEFMPTLSKADRAMFDRNPDAARLPRHVRHKENMDGARLLKVYGRYISRTPVRQPALHPALVEEELEPEPKDPDLDGLPERVITVLRLRAAGLSFEDIGRRINRSHWTARRDVEKAGLHVWDMRRKAAEQLQVHDA